MRNVFRKYVFGVEINRVVQFMTYSDIMILSGWGLVTPIIAVFFTNQVVGGSVALAGLASTAYFLTKSVLQIPVARFIDKRPGEWDDWWAMVIGSLIISLSAFSYILVRLPWQVILVQIMYGVGGALSYPSWLAIFTRHIDKKHEGVEWSLYFTSVDISAAISGGLGGMLAATFGYHLVFVIVGVFSLIGTMFLAGITRKLKKG